MSLKKQRKSIKGRSRKGGAFATFSPAPRFGTVTRFEAPHKQSAIVSSFEGPHHAIPIVGEASHIVPLNTSTHTASKYSGLFRNTGTRKLLRKRR